jgi:molybdopterin converting factor small subunit
MASINFTYALRRFFPEIKQQEVEASSVREVLDILEQRFSGIRGYILDDQGRLREHVNIFLNGELIKDKITQQDAVGKNDEIFIMQALSGGKEEEISNNKYRILNIKQ